MSKLKVKVSKREKKKRPFGAIMDNTNNTAISAIKRVITKGTEYKKAVIHSKIVKSIF